MTSGLPTGFRFGGRLSLDLAWTLAQRHWMPVELLAVPASLARWFVSAEILTDEPKVSERLFREAKALRESIYSAATAVIGGRGIRKADIATINRGAALPGITPQLVSDGRSVTRISQDTAAAALATVARDAVDLFGQEGSDRIRECARPGCSLVFFDASRPKTRRWCSMDGCGNVVNTARYRDRRA